MTTPEKPPYARYAFLNPYNLSLLASAGVASFATGHWGLGVLAVAAETVWMLFAPDSKLLRQAWFDPKFADEKRLRVDDVRGGKFRNLGYADQQRAQAFWDATRRVEQMAKENPSLTADLIRSELVKLEELYDDFLELGQLASRGEAHLSKINYAELNALWAQYTEQIAQFPESDRRRAIAKQNLDVLAERKKRIDEVGRGAQAARGQMDLLDNTLRLLGDEIVAMTAPSELAERLDQLRVGVAAIRETSADLNDNELESFDEALAKDTAKRAAR